MTRRAGSVWLAAVMFAGTPHAVEAQGYRIRLDSRVQTVGFRGVMPDSIPAAEAVVGENGGFETPDGFAVRCRPGFGYCTYYRPGPERRAGPVVSTADVRLWGFGVRGLSLHATTRIGVDVGDTDVWPGTDPAVQLIEGYAEFARPTFAVRAGRMYETTRLGFTAYDGGRGEVRLIDRQVRFVAYAGRGLARALALPVTSPALDPLDDFQPRNRQWVIGGGGSWTSGFADIRAVYEREVDPGNDNLVAERVGVDLVVRAPLDIGFEAGADYDLAAGWWGSAEASVARGFENWGFLEMGARRYRPHFELWTIWGAFSPTPYHAAFGVASATPFEGLHVTARGEVYQYEETGAQTPLVRGEDDGWRWSLTGRYAVASQWSVHAGLHREQGPGAGSFGYEGGVAYQGDRLRVSTRASYLERPLEFRFDDAKLWGVGADVFWTVLPSLALRGGVWRYDEERRRPDAAQFAWDQFRLHAGVTLTLSSVSSDFGVPPAVMRIPLRGGRR